MIYTIDNSGFSHFGVPDEYQDENHIIEPRKEAMFDGYSFGDRLLEGVMFIATIEDDNTLSVKISPMSEDYFSELNESKWLDKALSFALTTDFFEGMDGEEDLSLIRLNGKLNYES
jgi:hypothetical protein